jgi:S-adenosylmethionine decarboxylase proenzyme
VHTVGRHLIIELFACDGVRIDSIDTVAEALRQAAAAIGATVVSEAFHRYAPQGVSGVLLIAESHLSVHTWPETGYVAVDIFTCGGLDPRPGAEVMGRALGAQQYRLQETVRGLPDEVATAQPLLPEDVLIIDASRSEDVVLREPASDHRQFARSAPR